jgi:23S rRNA (cytidine1920-2'-O)/16S rRNA (cytidine1409-2'-O)-methyltransferase
MTKKERIDILLVERGLAETREKAKRAVMAGNVYSELERIDKPGMKVNIDTPLEIKGKVMPYVGRGGFKLEKALQQFQFTVEGKIGADIGSSTGGFTDCALQNGAKKMYAIDVGYNQLAWKLRSDPRVIVMERTNFRYADEKMFNEGLPQFATIDVSFISLKLILPVVTKVLQNDGDVIALIKPQFEAGKEEIGKKGIIRDKKIHLKVVEEMIKFSIELGFGIEALTYSPITGGDGNIEFLLHLKWVNKGQNNLKTTAEEIVNLAHNELK